MTIMTENHPFQPRLVEKSPTTRHPRSDVHGIDHWWARRTYPIVAIFDTGGRYPNSNDKRIHVQLHSMDELPREVETFGLDKLVAIEEYSY